MSRRVYAHSKTSKDSAKPFRPARESPKAAAGQGAKPSRTRPPKAKQARSAPVDAPPAKARAKATRSTTTAKARPKVATRVAASAATARRAVSASKSTRPKVTVPKATKSRAAKDKTAAKDKRATRTRPSAGTGTTRRLAVLTRPITLRRTRGATPAVKTRPSGRPKATTRPPAGTPGSGTGQKKQPTSARTRRNRIPVALAAVFALAVLATSFPLSNLLTQRHQLATASAELHSLQHANKLLAEQQVQLNSKAEIDRLARQDYQLVSPGQTLYDVLPPSGSGSALLPGGTPSGDPGSQPLVSPDHAPNMSPDPGLPQVPTSASSSAATRPAPVTPTAPSTFWGRVSTTLEFWK